MALFEPEDQNAIYLSRRDLKEPLSTHSAFPFLLEDIEWATVEHYYQAMKFTNLSYQDKISRETDPKKALIMGRTRFKSTRKDWGKVRITMMTRAVYTKCKTHQIVTDALMSTGDSRLVESSQYDYFWGCGRDRRGENNYGQVLMRVRQKLRSEAEDQN